MRVQPKTKRKHLDTLAELLRRAREESFWLRNQTAGYSQTQITAAYQFIKDAATSIDSVQQLWDASAKAEL